MADVYVKKIDNTYIQIKTDPGIMYEMSDAFTFTVPGAKFMPLVKNKMWDGKIRLLNVMTGMVYLGLLRKVIRFCKTNKYTIEVDKKLVDFDDITTKDVDKMFSKYGVANFIEKKDYQMSTIRDALKYKRALFLSPTSSGKSFMMYLIARKLSDEGKKILLILPRIGIRNQIKSDFLEYNEGRDLDIHMIGGGADKNTDAKYVLTTWQSLQGNIEPDFFEKFDAVICDEAHNYKAKETSKILEKFVNSEYRFGFTGTIEDSKTHHWVLQGHFGPIVNVKKLKELMDDGDVAKFNVQALIMDHSNEDKEIVKKYTYQQEIDFIISHQKRNKYIAKLANKLDGNVLILFNFVEKHGDVLKKLLDKTGKKVYYIHGSIDKDGSLREKYRKAIENEENCIILASFGTFQEGISVKKIKHTILASPTKSKIRLLQSLGRTIRLHEDYNMVTIWDFADDITYRKKVNTTLKHFHRRYEIYLKENIDVKIKKIDLR